MLLVLPMYALQLPVLLLLRVLIVALELLERLCHFGACSTAAAAAAAAAAAGAAAIAAEQQQWLSGAAPRARRRRPAASAADPHLAGALLCSSLLCGSVGEASAAAALLPPGAPARMDAATIVIESFPASSPGCSGAAPTSVLRFSQECAVASGGSGALGVPLFISRIYRGASCGSGGLLETYKGKNCEAYVRPTLVAPAEVAEKGLLSSVALPAGMRWGAGSGGICDGRGTRTSCEYGRRHAAWSAAPTPVPARPTSSTFPANVGLTVVQLTPEQNAALNSGGGLSARPDASLLLLPLLTSSALGLLWVSTWAGQLAAS